MRIISIIALEMTEWLSNFLLINILQIDWVTSHYSTSNMACGPACSISWPECIHTFMSSTCSGFYSPAAPQSRHKAINPVSCLQGSKNGWYVEACNEHHACTMHPLPFHTNSFTNTKYRSFALTDSYPTCLVRPTSFTVNQNAIINCTEQKTTDSAPMQRDFPKKTKKNKEKNKPQAIN